MSLNSSHINYVEFKAHDLEKIKAFYTAAFQWVFTDYGPDYIAFDNSGLTGGFVLTDENIINGALIVLYHEELEQIKSKIVASGGKITLDIFSFPVDDDFIFQILQEMNWPFGRITETL